MENVELKRILERLGPKSEDVILKKLSSSKILRKTILWLAYKFKLKEPAYPTDLKKFLITSERYTRDIIDMCVNLSFCNKKRIGIIIEIVPVYEKNNKNKLVLEKYLDFIKNVEEGV